MIAVWSGREADALREAMRLSIDDFALHLGASRRGVARWSVGGAEAKLRWDMQRNLDGALARAPAEVRERFGQLCGAGAVGGEGVSRRALCANAAAAVGGLLSAAPALSEALSDLLLWPPEPTGAKPSALIHLERQVARLKMDYQAGHYGRAVAGLPALTTSLAEARGGEASRLFPDRIHRLASTVHHTTVALLLKLGDLPLAMLAAERCGNEAAASGDPLVIAAAARANSRVLLRAGHEERAVTVAMRAAETLHQATGLAGPRPLSAYGSLLLCGAVAAARFGDQAGGLSMLRLASQAASRLGMDGNFGWTAFGPTNVAQHRVSVLLALGDPAGALRVSERIVPERVLQAERRASYYVDSAHARSQLDRPGSAVSALQQAYAIAPDEVRLRPSTRQLVADLAEAARGPAKSRAARFAATVLRP